MYDAMAQVPKDHVWGPETLRKLTLHDHHDLAFLYDDHVGLALVLFEDELS